MNFKTMIRAAKQVMNKRSYVVEGRRVVNADGYMMVWAPTDEVESFNVDDEVVEDPPPLEIRKTKLAIDSLSPPLHEMVKVNSNYLRRVISAIETKGNEPVYLDIQSKRICLAVEQDGLIRRAAVACMMNEKEE